MGLLTKIKNLITKGKWQEDATEKTTEPEIIVPEPIETPDDIPEGESETATIEAKALEELKEQKKRLEKKRDRSEIEDKIDPIIRTQTDQTTYKTGEAGPTAGGLNVTLRAKYDQLLQGKVTDERLKEDILIHRDKVLRYRGIAEVTIFTQEFGKTAMCKISNSLPDDEAVISGLILGMTGKMGEILTNLRAGLSGTKMGNMIHSEIYVKTNTPITVTSVQISHTFA